MLKFVFFFSFLFFSYKKTFWHQNKNLDSCAYVCACETERAKEEQTGPRETDERSVLLRSGVPRKHETCLMSACDVNIQIYQFVMFHPNIIQHVS